MTEPQDAQSTASSTVSSTGSSAFAPIESVGALLDAARREGLRLVTSQADFDQTGLDFRVVHAHDEDGVPWVVRTPRRPAVVASARVEARVLALVRKHLPVAVPDWRVHTDQVIAYPRLVDVPAISIDPEAGVRWHRLDPAAPSDAFIASMAAALAALQRIGAAEIEAAGVPVKSIDDARQAHARAMDETRAVLAPPDVVWARWQRWLANDAIWPRHLALVHGDLHPGHMLLDEGGRLTGILDWTEAHIGDPSTDFALFAGAFGKGVLDTLITRFEAAGGATWPGLAAHAAERWAAWPAMAAKWGVDSGNEGVIEHARSFLPGLVAESA
ncbi:macrolide 2'-phosphotransferase [Sorangium sp. So ce1335]|uniref:macrolide 2'-phosphotransferase n=1 Tax=Sorangium sp. So ce1335 TaxID=3133335 RepID=UPI003F5FF93D